jgi:prepilin-type processing-associated H-X9-DG protein
LDATDEAGMPYSENLCPFPYINEDPPRSNVAFVDGHIVNQILVMTTRDIQPEEELFVDYGHEMDRTLWGQSKSADVGQELFEQSKLDDLRAMELAGLKHATDGVSFSVDGAGKETDDE